MKVVLCGLVVHPQHHFIRASPDGIVSCSCHNPRLLEIKCPFASRELTVKEAVQTKKVQYLQYLAQTGTYQLKSAHGHMDQVQCTMAACGLDSCCFVVWTPKDVVVVDVPFDIDHWMQLQAAATQFFSRKTFPWK